MDEKLRIEPSLLCEVRHRLDELTRLLEEGYVNEETYSQLCLPLHHSYIELLKRV